MESVKSSILAAASAAIGLALFSACSSTPIKMECKELQARIDFGNLTGDQLRFANEELDDCRNRAKAAEEKDSTLIEGAHERFTPSDSQ